MLRFLVVCFFGLLALSFLFFRYATEEDRALSLRILRGIKNALYQEATLHNPQGDIVPDALDNTLLERLKQEWCLAKGETPC